MDVQAYTQFLRGTQLVALRVLSADARCLIGPDEDGSSGPLTHSITSTGTVTSRAGTSAVLAVTHLLTATAAGEEDEVLRIKVRYGLTIESSEDIRLVHARLYAKHNGPFNTWPFFRQHVAQVTSEMGFPPLILGLRHS